MNPFHFYRDLFLCRMGLRRHLSTAEIVEQAVLARRLLSSEVGPITNVVFMVSYRLWHLSSYALQPSFHPIGRSGFSALL